MPLRSEQSGGDAMYLFCFLGRVHVYVCVRFCVYARSCVCAHATTSSSRARLRRHVGRMCRVSPSAIHHMPRRGVVVRVGARP